VKSDFPVALPETFEGATSQNVDQGIIQSHIPRTVALQGYAGLAIA